MAGVREYRDRMRRAAGHAQPGRLVRPPRGRRAARVVRGEVAVERVGKREAARSGGHVAKARTRDSTRRAGQAGRRDRRRAADRRRPADDRADRGSALPGTRLAKTRSPRSRQLLASYRRTLEPPSSPARGVPLRPHGPQGRRRRQRRHALLHPAAGRPRRRRPAVPAGRRRRSRRCSNASSGRARTRTTASGSSSGQRLMQAASDIFLGWQRITDLDGVTRDYYVRQFHDWKGSVDVETMQVPGAHAVRAHLRCHARPRPRPVGRPDRHRLVPREGRRVRPGDRAVRGRLRRPERARPRRVRRRRRLGTARRSDRHLAT